MKRMGDAELTCLIEFNAAALGLTVGDASLDGVLANMRVLAEHIERVMAFPLPSETPLAVDFRP